MLFPEIWKQTPQRAAEAEAAELERAAAHHELP